MRQHHSLRSRSTNQTMATSQPSEMQVEGEVEVSEAVKQIVELDMEEEEDPFNGLNNAQIAEIYHKMKPEDRRLFRQIKSFHKLYFKLHGHDAPSYHLARGIVREIFSGIPAADTEVIVNARAELLAAERLKDLYKQLGLAVPSGLQLHRAPEAAEYPPPPRFPSRQEKAKQAAQLQLTMEASAVPSEPDVKLDVKPPRRLANTYLGQPGLLKMLGAGDEEHIITKVMPGTDPLQEYDEDNPSELIVLDYETDESSDADDLSMVSMTSVGSIGKDEFQALLSDIAAQHQRMAASIDALAAWLEDMSAEQVEEAAVCVTSELGHIRGLEEITDVLDKTEVGLILATGVRKYHEYQTLKGKREEKDIISYRQLQRKFGANKRTLMECVQGYKCQYLGGKSRSPIRMKQT